MIRKGLTAYVTCVRAYVRWPWVTTLRWLSGGGGSVIHETHSGVHAEAVFHATECRNRKMFHLTKKKERVSQNGDIFDEVTCRGVDILIDIVSCVSQFRNRWFNWWITKVFKLAPIITTALVPVWSCSVRWPATGPNPTSSLGSEWDDL